MKKDTAQKPDTKAKAKTAPAKLKDLQPKKDARGGFTMPPRMGNHNETFVCETEI